MNPTTCLTSCPDGVCPPKKVCGNTAVVGRSCSVEARISLKKGKCVAGVNAGKACDAEDDCPGSTCPVGSPDGSIRSCDDVDADPFAPANELSQEAGGSPGLLRESALCKGSKLDENPAGIIPITIQTKVAPDPPLGSPEACLEPPVFCPPDVELPDNSIEPRAIALDPIGGRSGPYASQRVCRAALQGAATTVTQTALTALRECNAKVMTGELASGSCGTINGTSDPSGSVSAAVSAVQNAVTSSCVSSGHSPSDFGYRGCPAPCDGITVSTCTAGIAGPCVRDRDCDTAPAARDGRCGDWTALGNCVACQATVAALGVTAAAYGSGGPGSGLPSDVQNCQNVIGEGVATLIAAELKDAAKCQREVDEFRRLLSSRTPKCKDADPKGKRAKVRTVVAGGLIANCSHALLAQLDSCSANLAGLADCIPRIVRRGVGAVTDAAAPEGRCGDGKRAFTEKCDDGNAIDGDGCDSNCTPTGCGNGVISTGEECDDGGIQPGDGCDPTCHAEQQPCTPQMCANFTFDCSSLFPGDCVCLQSAEGPGLCVNNFDCNSAQPCSSSVDCSTPGERCYLQTCCGGPLPGRCGPPTCTGQPG